jgi:DNA mismatch repair protein MutS
VPKSVIKRAKQKLALLESHQSISEMPLAQDTNLQQVDLFSNSNPVLDELERIEPDNLTAKQALDIVYRLKQLADN